MSSSSNSIAGRILDALLTVLALGLSGILLSRFIGQDQIPTGMRELDGWEADLRHPRRIGAQAGPLTLVVWTDYECPACRRFEEEVHALRGMLNDSISIVYRYFPLPAHRQARSAAIIAECAWRQGGFESVHNQLFEANIQDSIPLEPLALARRAGISDLGVFETCVRERQTAGIVETDVQRGTAIGIRGTPTLQIGKYVRTGGQFADSLLPLLRAAVR